MEYRKSLAILSIVGVAGATTLAAPPTGDKSTKPNQSTATEQRQGKTEERENARADHAQGTAWRNGDHFLASCVAMDNQEEIALGRWAEEQLQSNEAKEFARMLVKDHSEYLAKLQQHAPEAAGEHFLTSAGSSPRPEGQQRDDRKETDTSKRDGVRNLAQPAPRADNATDTQSDAKQTTASRHKGESGNLNVDLMQLHREIAEQCLADTKEMLGKKSDKERDACFVGLQIAKHAAMKTKLQVFQRHATGELKELLSQGEAATTKHMEHAEKLMKQLSDTRTASK